VIERVAALALAATLLAGCKAPRPAPRWQPPPAASSWSGHAWPASQAPPTPAPQVIEVPAPAARPPEGGSFLLLVALAGPTADRRQPDVNAALARLGGVRRAPSLWEMLPQPGGGLAGVAATLERGLCAEDIVTVWRARGGGLERLEFAGHRACPAPEPPPAPPRLPRPTSTPRPAPPAPAPPGSAPGRPVDPFDQRF
jgi:hypothetical protein